MAQAQILDVEGVLASLRAECVAMNAHANAFDRLAAARGQRVTRRRWVIDLKYRGPRHGDRYTTPRWASTHVDVYRRLRREYR